MIARQFQGHRFRPQVEGLEARVVPALFAPAPAAVDGAVGSLRAALTIANVNNQNDVIVLRAGTYHLSVLNLDNAIRSNLQENAAATGDLDVTEANRLVVIQGQGAGLTIIDATGLNDRVFHILANARLELRGVTVRGGVATEQGSPGVPNGDSPRRRHLQRGRRSGPRPRQGQGERGPRA